MRILAVMVVSVAMASCGGGSDDPAVDGGGADGTTTGDGATSDSAIDSATAVASSTWQLVPNAVCTGIVTQCSNQGGAAAYQLAGTGNCPLASFLSVDLPGPSVPASGTYTVRAAATLLDLANVPAGQVALRIAHAPNTTTQENWFAQSGSVTVTNTGGRVTLAPTGNLPASFGAMTSTMSASVTCP